MDGLLEAVARARHEERTERAHRASATREPAQRTRAGCPLERLAAWFRSRRRQRAGVPVGEVRVAQ